MRRLIGAASLAALLMTLTTPAFGSHTHVRMTGNGSCVVLAENGAEKMVTLPHADTYAENRRHPLHVNVHLGHPGMVRGEMVVWVQGMDGGACQGLLND